MDEREEHHSELFESIRSMNGATEDARFGPQVGFALGLAATLFLLVNLTNLTPDQDWGGDFAQYLTHARNILEGRSFDAGIEYAKMLNPGLPVVEAAVASVLGFEFMVFKFLNVLVWLLSTGVVLALLRTFLEGRILPVLGFIWLLFLPFFYRFKHRLQVDHYLLLTLLIAIWILTKLLRRMDAGEQASWADVVWVTASVAFASLFKPSALALLGTICLVFFFVHRDIRLVVFPLGVHLAGYGLQLALTGRSSILSYSALAIGERGPTQLRPIYEEPTALLARSWAHYAALGEDLFEGVGRLGTEHIGTALAVLSLVGLVMLWRRDSAGKLLVLYLVLQLVMLGMYPFRPRPRLRLVLLPVFLLALLMLLDRARRRWVARGARGIVVALICLVVATNLLVIDWGYDRAEATHPDSIEAYRWIRRNYPDGSILLSRKPRVFHFFTGIETRRAVRSYAEIEAFENGDRPLYIAWITIHPEVGPKLATSPRYEQVFTTPTLSIYRRVDRPLSASGSPPSR